jgi:predicted nucleotidyltransferase
MVRGEAGEIVLEAGDIGAVKLPPRSSLLDLVGLQMDLRDALGLDVDANTYRAIHPLIRDRVLSDEIRVL